MFGKPIPGQTPLDDPSGLIDKNIRTLEDLNRAEFANVGEAILKYLSKKPSRRLARFDLAWTKKLHREMFGKVWIWAGDFRFSLTWRKE